MKSTILKLRFPLAFLLTGILAAGPAMADKPSGAGKGKGKEERAERRDDDKGERHDRGGAASERRHFEDRHRALVHDYYSEQFRGGRCPPGLAKKNNGCMPPGQAKKWQVGRALPRDVVYYEVPQQLVVQIGVPPTGYRYVRVASDILMIAIGTGMVIDAIQNLGG